MPAIGKNLPHDAAITHVCGTSQFICDIPKLQNELVVDFVISEEAHANILSIETEKALEIEGIAGIYTSADITSPHKIGPVFQDEYLLAKGKVEYAGQPIVIIAAEDEKAIKKAKSLIKISYKKLNPILSIEEAIEENSFIAVPRSVSRGDIEEGFLNSKNLLEGEVYCGGQEHFYLEPHSALTIPGENGEFKVYSATQNPTDVQMTVAEVLEIPLNKIVVETKRLGGSFGGKESQSSYFAAMTAFVAHKTNRPARIILEREKDITTTGKRHPFLAKYKVGFSSDGIINSLDVNLFSNGGYACDLSTSVMDKSILHADNAYFVPNIKITGKICRTNLASNTAFRGFGIPQAVLSIESIIEDIAVYLKKDAKEIRELNFYKLDCNNTAPYGQVIENNTLQELMEKISESAEYKARVAKIADFNKNQSQKLRGISCIPMKYGIAFTAKFLNQANALVNIYTDGSIQVSTCGIEMGQGLNTKIRQIVAQEFKIGVENIRVMATCTEKNNNGSPTASSTGLDLNGGAVVNACQKLKDSIVEFAAGLFNPQNPNKDSIIWSNEGIFDSRDESSKMSFKEMVKAAYFNRVNLGERGFYITPKLNFDWDSPVNRPFNYFTNGCSVSEVEIDRFTGELKVSRADVLMDIGNSLNPGIDRGQIYGGFVQGQGWVTMEELKYSKDGKILSNSPANYKIPSIHDAPKEFNIGWIENDKNTHNVAKSKAIGEPPFVLAVSVWTAVKNALSYLTDGEVVSIKSPATSEEILKFITKYEKN